MLILLLLFSIKLTDSCIPTVSPEDLEEIIEEESTTTTTTTTTSTSTTTSGSTTTTTPDNSACQLCPNPEMCDPADEPPGRTCVMSTSSVTRVAGGCQLNVDCTAGGGYYDGWYKLASTGMWVDGGTGDIMVTCGDYPNNQWKDPAGNVITKTTCA